MLQWKVPTCCEYNSEGIRVAREIYKAYKLTMNQLSIKNDVRVLVMENKKEDQLLQTYRDQVINSKQKDFYIVSNGASMYQDMLYVSNTGNMRNLILKETHSNRYIIHLGTTKMYQDLKKFFWWPRTKKDITKFVAKCLTCQKIKIKHQKPVGLLQPLEIQEWKLDKIDMDFVMGLHKISLECDAIWVIVERLTKSAHFLAIRAIYSLDKLA